MILIPQWGTLTSRRQENSKLEVEMGVVNVLLFILALGFTILIHETGHFLVLKQRRLVKAFTIGIPIPGLTLKFERGGIVYQISPLLVMGNVEPVQLADRRIEKQKLWFQLLVYSSGALANIAFLTLLTFLEASLSQGVLAGLNSIPKTLLIVGFLLKETVTIVFHPVKLVKETVGPIGAAQVFLKVVEQAPSYWTRFSWLLRLCNALIGTFQLFPWPPFDGWKIIATFLKKFLGKKANLVQKVEVVMLLFMLGLIAYTWIRELIGLF